MGLVCMDGEDLVPVLVLDFGLVEGEGGLEEGVVIIE